MFEKIDDNLMTWKAFNAWRRDTWDMFLLSAWNPAKEKIIIIREDVDMLKARTGDIDKIPGIDAALNDLRSRMDISDRTQDAIVTRLSEFHNDNKSRAYNIEQTLSGLRDTIKGQDGKISALEGRIELLSNRIDSKKKAEANPNSDIDKPEPISNPPDKSESNPELPPVNPNPAPTKLEFVPKEPESDESNTNPSKRAGRPAKLTDVEVLDLERKYPTQKERAAVAGMSRSAYCELLQRVKARQHAEAKQRRVIQPARAEISSLEGDNQDA